jgi:hypothetical protein
MPQVKRLRCEAARCYRLAHGIADARLCEELEAIGREFERQAEALEIDDRVPVPA